MIAEFPPGSRARARRQALVPRQLPRAAADWVDREQLLTALDRFADGERHSPPLVGLVGMGGIGKTALAVRWAHHAAARFPDGQLFIRLGAHDPAGPRTPGDALSAMLRAVGVPDGRIPAGVDEQAGLWRTVTADRRILLLLDNAAGPDQIEPLIPAGPASLVLITIRARHPGLITAGVRILAVPPLPHDAAALLLHRVAGAHADHASTGRLLDFCAGLPLALTVTGAGLATLPRGAAEFTTVHHGHADVLADQKDMIMNAFAVSYAGLPEGARTCYQALGLHPGPDVGLPVIAGALDTSLLVAERHLRRLVQVSLIEEEPAGRYRMHDQIRRHAVLQAASDPEQQHQMIARISEWYLAAVRGADAVATPYREPYPAEFVHFSSEHGVEFPDPAHALEWLESEQDNLLALADVRAADDPRLVWLLIDSMWALFMFRRRHDVRERADALALDCARRAGNPTWIAHAWRRLGWNCYDLGNLDGAADAFGNAVDAAADITDDNTRTFATATAQEGLAAVAQAHGDYARALELIAAQRGQYLARGDFRREGLSALHHAIALIGAGRPEEALPVLEDARHLFFRTAGTDPYNAARIGLEHGRALTGLGRHDAAQTWLEAALQEMTALDRPRGRALAQHYLGELAQARGDLDGARTRLEIAAALYGDLGDREERIVRAALAALDHA